MTPVSLLCEVLTAMNALRRIARTVAAVAALGAGLLCSVTLLSLFGGGGIGNSATGIEDLVDGPGLTILAGSTAFGMIGIVGYRTILGWPARSWWLLAALIPPVGAAIGIAVG